MVIDVSNSEPKLASASACGHRRASPPRLENPPPPPPPQSNKKNKNKPPLQLPRLLRLLRLFEVFQSHRVQRAFKLLKRVVLRRGEDIAAALLVMAISLIFLATVMYVVEGGSHEVSLRMEHT